MRTHARSLAPVAMLASCALTLALSYSRKATCAGPPFDSKGRSLIFDRIKDARLCYTDIQFLWLGRSINEHVFPYVHGAIAPGGALIGGAVEYPVLTGILMWLGAIGAHTDAQFLAHSALLLAPFGLLTAWLLGRMAGWTAALWSAGPPLYMYAFHNWDLPVVAATTAAIAVMTIQPSVSWLRMSFHTRAITAAALLGAGFCLKTYPGFFVAPLALCVLLHGAGGNRYDVRGAAKTVAAATITVVLCNLPVLLAGPRGWWAAIDFQSRRTADVTSNSIWYWGLRPFFGGSRASLSHYNNIVGTLSAPLILSGFALALWLGWRVRYQQEGYPWIGVSAAMLCVFLLFHKVHSPQYTLWLVPFLVLLSVPWALIAGYLIADLCIGVGVFQYYYYYVNGTAGEANVLEQVVLFGVWGRAALLVPLFFFFIHAAPRWRTAADSPANALRGLARV